VENLSGTVDSSELRGCGFKMQSMRSKQEQVSLTSNLIP